MKMKLQRNLASKVMKCGNSRVWFEPSRIADISEAITTEDVRKLIKDGLIKEMPQKGLSSFRKKKMLAQKAKGRRKGSGSRKGKAMKGKKLWIKKIRTLRAALRELKDSGRIDNKTYRHLYMVSKSGFFRSRSHLMNYLEKNSLLKEKIGSLKEKSEKDEA